MIDRGGTNPTAAAVALLLLKPDEPPLLAADCRPTIQFRACRRPTAACGRTRRPAGDLLSTCTGLVALADLEGLDAVNLDRVAISPRTLRTPLAAFAARAGTDRSTRNIPSTGWQPEPSWQRQTAAEVVQPANAFAAALRAEFDLHRPRPPSMPATGETAGLQVAVTEGKRTQPSRLDIPVRRQAIGHSPTPSK